ncbi:ROK family transcriptional regulator [Curtobacterium pusillum]|uniref:ROK family protein n=1 Tax=Curtobacterium pusillum TaxID=69373 RepID=A0ABX2MBF0_9MICO|nr:ROK family protein [Curtobacterium pusillum]NUU12666.1 ROK family protein [Curtobacterium pusillum]
MNTVALLLALIRSSDQMTRPELIRQTDLGRAVVNQRIEQAINAGLVVETDEVVSTGGRPSHVLRINADRGLVLAAVFGVSRLHVAITDLQGRILRDQLDVWDVNAGPDSSMDHLHCVVTELLEQVDGTLWAAGIGVPGPVDFESGTLVSPPIMSGWDKFPVRSRLERLFGVPVWVDNDANLMALGTWRETRLAAGDNVILVKAGTGIGAGLISRGRLHRGARGAAGDFGHGAFVSGSSVRCRCGKFGCLEANAGGWALARDASAAAALDAGAYLGRMLQDGRQIHVEDVVEGALDGDSFCAELIHHAGELIGAHLATLVSFFNPSTVFIGGSLVRVGDVFIDAIRSGVTARSLALATDDLLIAEVPLNHFEGVIGAAMLALDEIFSAANLGSWWADGTPQQLRVHGAALFREVLSPAARAELMSSVTTASGGLALPLRP